MKRAPVRLDSGTLMVNAALLVLSTLTVFPLLWMLSASFMAAGEASQFPPPLLPAAPTLDHYRSLFSTCRPRPCVPKSER